MIMKRLTRLVTMTILSRESHLPISNSTGNNMITTTILGSNLPVMQSQHLLKEAGIVHFCTLRGGNDSPYARINLCDYTGDDPRHVALSRKLFADCLGIVVEKMWFPRQV